jgi:hypothetical protein
MPHELGFGVGLAPNGAMALLDLIARETASNLRNPIDLVLDVARAEEPPPCYEQTRIQPSVCL